MALEHTGLVTPPALTLYPSYIKEQRAHQSIHLTSRPFDSFEQQVQINKLGSPASYEGRLT